MICPTEKRGDSELYGSWKTICISRLSGRRSDQVRALMSRPRNWIGPMLFSSRSSPMASVVLPDPLSPTTPSVRPSRTVTETPSTALMWPTTRRRMPRLTGNQTFRSSAAITGSAAPSAATGLPLGSAASRCLV